VPNNQSWRFSSDERTFNRPRSFRTGPWGLPFLASLSYDPAMSSLSSCTRSRMRALKLVDRIDPVTSLIAKKIIDLRAEANATQQVCNKRPCRLSRKLPNTSYRDL
jgi:hypothetical protein